MKHSLLLKERGAAGQAGARTPGGESRMQVLLASGEITLQGLENRKNHSHVAHVGRPHSTAGIHAACVGIIAAVLSSLTAAARRKAVSGGVPKGGLLADDLISSFDKYLYP